MMPVLGQVDLPQPSPGDSSMVTIILAIVAVAGAVTKFVPEVLDAWKERAKQAHEQRLKELEQAKSPHVALLEDLTKRVEELAARSKAVEDKLEAIRQVLGARR